MRDPTAKVELSFPKWFPPFIQADARHLHTKAVESGPPWKVAMIERLVGDARMERVWAELSQRQRDKDHKYQRTDLFEHSAIPPEFARSMGAATIQQKALRLLFVETVIVANYCFYLLKKSEQDVVTEIANFMRRHFGKPMRGTTSILASVVLERDITPSKVREWTRTRKRRTRKRRTRGSTPGGNPRI